MSRSHMAVDVLVCRLLSAAGSFCFVSLVVLILSVSSCFGSE